MTLPSKTAAATASLARRDLAEYGVARFRDQVFDAVTKLWRRRKAEGWTQKQVAELIGRDTGWVSKNLRAPGNWTVQTAGEIIQALEGEASITIAALEDPSDSAQNYNAYDGYLAGPLYSGVYQANPISESKLSQIIIGERAEPCASFKVTP